MSSKSVGELSDPPRTDSSIVDLGEAGRANPRLELAEALPNAAQALSDSPNANVQRRDVIPTVVSLDALLTDVKNPVFPFTQHVYDEIQGLPQLVKGVESHTQKIFLVISRLRDVTDFINGSIQQTIDSDTAGEEEITALDRNMELLDVVESALEKFQTIPRASFQPFSDSSLVSWRQSRQILQDCLDSLCTLGIPSDNISLRDEWAAVRDYDDISWIGTIHRRIQARLHDLAGYDPPIQDSHMPDTEDPKDTAARLLYEKFTQIEARLYAQSGVGEGGLRELIVILGSTLYLLLGGDDSYQSERWLKLDRALDQVLSSSSDSIPAGVLSEWLDSVEHEQREGPVSSLTHHFLSFGLQPESRSSFRSVPDNLSGESTFPSDTVIDLIATSDPDLLQFADATPPANTSSVVPISSAGASPHSSLLGPPHLIFSSKTPLQEDRKGNVFGDRVEERHKASGTLPEYMNLPLPASQPPGGTGPPLEMPQGSKRNTEVKLRSSGPDRHVPPEVWGIVLDSLATDRDWPSLSCVSRTCQSLYLIVLPFLWAEVKVDLVSTPQTRAIACFQAIKENPRISPHVRFIVVVDRRRPLGDFVPALKRCENLQSLELFGTMLDSQLCEILHELPRLRELRIQNPSFTAVGCTSKLTPMAIVSLRLSGFNFANAWGLDFLASLAAARNLQVLVLGAALCTAVLRMYTSSGIPPALSVLYLSTKPEHRPLVSALLDMPNCPFERISVQEAHDQVGIGGNCDGIWAPIGEGPAFLSRLRSIAGGIDFVLHLSESVGGLERIVIHDWLDDTNEFQEILHRVKERNSKTLKTLAFRTDGAVNTWFGMVSDAFPGLTNLALMHRGTWTADDLPINAIRSFHSLKRITTLSQGGAGDPSGKMSNPEGPSSWEAKCPELRQIDVTDKWTWRRLERGGWVKERLHDEWWDGIFYY